MEYHAEEDIPYPRIKFIKQPETFGCKMVGEIYQQTGPFQQVERDWNQDGDVYAQKIAGFQKMTDVNAHAHDYFYLSEHDFFDLMLDNCIEYVKQPELGFDPIKNLIRAMTAYGLEFTWNDSEIIDALVGLGITYEDFCQAGAGDFVKSYFEEDTEKQFALDAQPKLLEQAMSVLDGVLAKPNGHELFYIANILYMLQQDETPLDREEQLTMAQRILDVSTCSAVPLLTAERVDAVCTLLNNGITNRRSPEFPETTPVQMKKLLLTCDIDIFTEIIETVAVDNQKFYGPDNEYSEYAIEQRKKAVNAIQNVAQFEDIDITDREAVEQEVWNLLERAERKSHRKLNTDSPYYKGAMELVEGHCACVFPDLYEMLSDPSVDLLFKDGTKEDYNLFYYNPDSNTGGQTVQCPFSEEQASRMMFNENYIDVLAENTQYLYDIDDICFFDCVFHLLDLKNAGHYLGNDIDIVCYNIRTQNKENSTNKPSLNSQIKFASTRAEVSHSISPVKSKEPEPQNKTNRTEEMIEEIETLHNNAPDGVIVDADTLLVDLIEECDYEFSGFAHDIFDIWKKSTDQKAVEQMFYEFTGMEFVDYLLKCKAKITREPELGVQSKLSGQIQSASNRATKDHPAGQQLVKASAFNR